MKQAMHCLSNFRKPLEVAFVIVCHYTATLASSCPVNHVLIQSHEQDKTIAIVRGSRSLPQCLVHYGASIRKWALPPLQGSKVTIVTSIFTSTSRWCVQHMMQHIPLPRTTCPSLWTLQPSG